MANSNPNAIRQPLGDAGPFTGGAPKLLWHTTEGSTYPGPHIYHQTHPHFTLDFKRKRLYQHAGITRAAKALAHPAGVGETNKDNVVQVELVGFAAQSGQWSRADYRQIASLARWIERNHHVPRKAANFKAGRMVWSQWHGFAGHCGHRHCPGNDHTDPGVNFRIDLVLRVSKLEAWRAELAHLRAMKPNVKRLARIRALIRAIKRRR